MPAQTNNVAMSAELPRTDTSGTTSCFSIDALAAKLDLRDYQRRALRKAVRLSNDRGRVHVLALPTGSGKTRVGVGLAACHLGAGHAVLWVCKRWHLLQQAADQLAELLPQYRPALRRIGGGNTCLRHLPEGLGGRVYFTTLQTWFARRHRLPRPARPSANLAAVWDEAHWGLRRSWAAPSARPTATAPSSTA